jgi:hypothetical protein
MMLCLVLAACGTPIEVQRVDARTVQTELTSNAVSTGRLSGSSQIVLHQQDLETLYEEAPADGIMALHRIVAAGNAGRDALYALAEMAFLEGERTGNRSYSLAAVVYAYAFLFPSDPAARPNPFDPRLRAAADIYNRALTEGLATANREYVDLRAGDYPLPFGTLSISFEPNALRWANRDLTNYVPAATRGRPVAGPGSARLPGAACRQVAGDRAVATGHLADRNRQRPHRWSDGSVSGR